MESDRKLIHSHKGEKISYLQIIGFLVILFGLVYLVTEQILCKLNGEVLAVDFFIIMLGMALAFPDLLQDKTKGISTMRIVVFMMVNVICILLLKIGWNNTTLKAIGLDQYWMGVIAFIFGAKATQSYFESKLAVPGKVGDADATTPAANNTNGRSPATTDDEDGCGVQSTNPTADQDLPASKGGVA